MRTKRACVRSSAITAPRPRERWHARAARSWTQAQTAVLTGTGGAARVVAVEIEAGAERAITNCAKWLSQLPSVRRLRGNAA